MTKKISIAPRPPINQGIDKNHPMVLEHNRIYETLLGNVQKGKIFFSYNPYGTAPLSGYAGVWATTADPFTIRITSGGAVPVEYKYSPVIGANLIPLVGLVPAAFNSVHVIYPDGDGILSLTATGPLPLTDEEKGEKATGFPVYQAAPAVNPPAKVSELYFTAWIHRNNVGVDHTGTVRWYTTQDIAIYNFERLANGNFISSYPEIDDNLTLYEFDLVGRVHKVYVLDNKCHHSIQQLSNGNLIMPSERTGETIEDGVSIIDINTGLEVAYYDLNDTLDRNRAPIPSDPLRYLDWCHINQAYINETNNLVIGSSRHQGVFALDADSGELVFMLSTHVDWAEEYQQYLLTPVDENGNPLYDLTDPDDIDKADKEFWNWGQHAVMDIPNKTKGIVEFVIFDNGNWRSRDRAKALIPNDNYSEIVHYKIDINKMTVQKLYAYGKAEEGNRGYSSYVCNQQLLENGNYFINFGGGIIDEHGRRRSIFPGAGDIIDPRQGSMAMGLCLLQEIDPHTNTAVADFTVTSGKFKDEESQGEDFWFDLFSFRAHKFPIIP